MVVKLILKIENRINFKVEVNVKSLRFISDHFFSVFLCWIDWLSWVNWNNWCGWSWINWFSWSSWNNSDIVVDLSNLLRIHLEDKGDNWEDQRTKSLDPSGYTEGNEIQKSESHVDERKIELLRGSDRLEIEIVVLLENVVWLEVFANVSVGVGSAFHVGSSHGSVSKNTVSIGSSPINLERVFQNWSNDWNRSPELN